MADGEILRRLFGYAKPYLRQFVVVGFLVLFSISYDIASPSSWATSKSLWWAISN